MAQSQYITVAELIEAADTRVLAQLGSDTGSALSPVSGDAQGILAAAIEWASARVQMNAKRGGRYDSDRLDALVTADDWALKGLVATLAYYRLHWRRGGSIPPAILDEYEKATALLEALARGEVIFSDEAVEGAGKAAVAAITSGRRGDMGLVSDTRFFRSRRIRTF